MTVYIPTGIDHLNDLLSPDRDREKDATGGILVGDAECRKDWETPIVVIEGTTGAGKTTLAFQIAHAAARCGDDDPPCWDVYFFSLEQSFASLARMANGFGGFKSSQRASHDPPSDIAHVTLIDEAAFDTNKQPPRPWISVCHFSPRPIADDKPIDLFDNRLRQLQYVLDHPYAADRPSLCVIDSFSAFCDTNLRRSDVHRLFDVFRRRHVPAIVTLETSSDEATSSPDGDQSLESTHFLADIVISMSKQTRNRYLQMYLEIRKSRQCRQTIGEHLYRIRSAARDSDQRIEQRTGIVVYPSIHYVLFKARRRSEPTPRGPNTQSAAPAPYRVDFAMESQRNRDKAKPTTLGEVLQGSEVGPTSNFAIVGPNGTHKLALAMNLAMGVRDGRDTPKLMVLNFGGQGDVQFSGIAWTPFNAQWRRLQDFDKDSEDGSHERNSQSTVPTGVTTSENKFWYKDYAIEPQAKEPVVRVVTFKIGQLAPEECLDILGRMLEDADPAFTSVLLNNTAEIATGFPQLKAEQLFLPTLLDIFVEHSLVAVCIGIDDTGGETAQLSNFTLLANADYRMRLSHYPTMENLSGEIVEHSRSESDSGTTDNDTDKHLIQQLVSLVIDNVTGKHYARVPRWVSVEGDPDKVLICGLRPRLSKPKEPTTPTA